MNSGTRAAMTALLSGEMVTIIGEARWLLLAVTMAVVADFWLGWSESRLRYAKAKRKGDKIVMSQYRWRTSRAWRRTLNKLVDYVVWLALGVFTGMAVLQPLGVDYRMGGVFAAIVAILCEAKSVVGHFLYLHGLTGKDGSSLTRFLKTFAVALAKRKDNDLGESLEEALGGDGGKGNIQPTTRKTEKT